MLLGAGGRTSKPFSRLRCPLLLILCGFAVHESALQLWKGFMADHAIPVSTYEERTVCRIPLKGKLEMSFLRLIHEWALAGRSGVEPAFPFGALYLGLGLEPPSVVEEDPIQTSNG